ncbi:MAG: hypothetical protein AAFZ52_11205, partial [Bacteroidota bacterium]
MKNLFRKLPRRRNFGGSLSLAFFLVLLTFFLSAPSLFAQVDETGGPIVLVDYEPVCTNDTTIYAVYQKVVGVDGTTLLGYVDGQGNAYTP